MQRIFISDLHLEDPSANAFLRFAECLAVESAQVDEIYILGDLMEMWVGDDDDDAPARRLNEVLRQTTPVCPVFIMHGNRDFLFGDAFASANGVTLIQDPHTTSDGLLLSHGDGLCIDDHEYQALRTTLRSQAWQDDILAKSLDERKAFGTALRAQSKANNANKPGNIMDVNDGAVTTALAASHAHTLIHGHTHRPGVHKFAAYTRIVTGAWERCGWLCRQRDEQLQLECFSLARHYGT